MRYLILPLFFSACFSFIIEGQTPEFLKRTLSDVLVKKADISGESAYYKPIFGDGDSNAETVKCIARYGFLSIDSGGSSSIVRYEKEEQVIFILEGTGNLHYAKETVPVTKSDFVYIPVGVEYGLSNPREKTLKVIVMGYKIPDGTKMNQTQKLMIANADEVPLQVLGQHGPTTQFQLLMGTTESKRDRLAAACQVNSLFIMDFAAGGTNIPHIHEREEEVYFVLRGNGEMVAGQTSDGKEIRFPAKEGDVFYFSPCTLIGFYSATREGEEHARILAVRSKFIVPDSGGK
ncbi:MAG: cupin domain-containing protein [Bacteroidales bacterium]|nr:cupin domain-containing protein [Bacteroidales bacterium]MDP3001768.1 cupin domain-containing protein [Bacteroidales bacterium]